MVRISKCIPLVVTVILLCTLMLQPAAVAAPAAPLSNALRISQIYGGGGNSGATYTHDFIEIFNSSGAPVSLNGLSLQYASATGNFGGAANMQTELPNVVLQAGQYYLVQEAKGSGGTTPLPTPDLIDATPIAMSATAGKVALVTGTTGLGCGAAATPCGPAQLALMVDLVGFGTTANLWEGAGRAPAPSNTTAIFRANAGCTDTDSNSADFATAAPAPRNTASPLNLCAGGDLAPAVDSTDPANGASGVARGTNVTITFSEAVNTTGTWFTIACSSSGSHNAVAGGGPTAFTLDPGTDFSEGESCGVTVLAAQVADQDANDPPDNMAADYSWTFTVESAPTVLSTDPANGAPGVAAGADLTINFSEAVKVTGAWYTISCGSSGGHTAVASGGPSTWTLNPDADFAAGALCTVVLESDYITDQDASDPPDKMAADYSWSFTIAAAPMPSILINELDSDTPGTDALEFIELYDGGTGNTALDGLVVVFFNGSNDLSYAAYDLDGYSTDAGGYFVLGNAAVKGVDLVFGGNLLQNGADAAALYTANGADFPNNTPVTTSNLVDAIVYETGDADDLGLLVLLNAGQPQVDENAGGSGTTVSNQRCPNGTGGARNTGTYTQFMPTPGTVNCVVPPEACGDPYTAIHDVQGNGAASAKVGETVSVEGIVVGDFQNSGAPDDGDLNGFHLQAPVAEVDADPNTSEAIFIYYPGGATDVLAGDRVRVRGPVSEYYGLTEITVGQLWVCSNGNTLPAATPLTLPAATVTDAPLAADYFEPYEGMLVTFPQALTISEYFDFDRYNAMVLSDGRLNQPTAVYEPGSTDQAALALANSRNRITLDDGRTDQNPNPALHPDGTVFDMSNLFRGGDTLQNVTGVIDYSFDLYRIQPTQGAIHVEANPRPALPADVGGRLKVASFNLLNYFTTLATGTPPYYNDTPLICGPNSDQECRGANTIDEFNRQRAKIIDALVKIDADIVGLVETENHPGDVPVADLVAGLNAALIDPNDHYTYIATGAIGGDAIRQALIYRPATVTPLGAYAILDSSVDSRFIDTKNRPVLAQTFRENATGGVLTVAVNHLKSKGSDCNDVGDPDLGGGAGNCNLTRKAAAEALADWLASDPTGSGDDDYLIIGDLNSYDKEDPIDALLAAGYTDLIRQFEGEYAYSYVFDGQVGYLDYGLANASLVGEVSGATAWHINADEPDLINYDMDFKEADQDALYAADAFRAADHDPLIIGLDLTAGKIVVEKQTLPDGTGPSFAFSGALTADLADGQIQALEVPTGTFTVAEMVPAGWDLTDITCVDPTADSTGLASAAVATYTVGPGETVTCTFTNTQRGQIVVEKETLPDGAQESFAFSGAWSGSLSDGQSSLPVEVPAGTHTVSETVPAGWDLADITCSDGNSSGVLGTATATYEIGPAETVTCTFTNTQRGKIVVEKETLPDGAQESFAFSGAWSGSLSDGQSSLPVEVPAGTHTVSEIVPVGWNLTDITCIDPTADSTWDIGTAAATYEVAPGETVTCTFTNTDRGKIIVEKQTLPDGAAATFHFSGTLTADLADGQSESRSVRPGTYQVSEVVPGGWDLTGIACSDGDSGGDLATATATFRVKAGETVRCVFTNTQQGRIIVEKQTDPDGDPTEFIFSGLVNGPLRDGERLSRRVPPGTYHVTEAVPEGWKLLTLWCTDQNSSGNLATATATFRVAPGETVRCTFGNTKLATAVVEKQTLPDGAADLFEFEGVAPGMIADGGQLVAGGLLPGGYRASEVAPEGWLLSAVTCTDPTGDSAGDAASGEAIYHLAAGEVVTCTFTNARKGSVTVVKDAAPDTAQPFFFSGDLGNFPLVDNGTASSQVTFLDLAAGQYRVRETAVAGWPLAAIACDDPDGGTVVDLAAAAATIDLDAGEAIVCTFTNRGQADLSLTKTAEPEVAQRGGPVSYTLTVANAGPAAAGGVVVSDVVPAELEGVWFEASRVVTPTGTIPYRWELGTLAAGETVVLRVYGTVRTDLGAEFSFENVASVGNGAADPAPGNNSAVAAVWVADGAPVAVDDAYSTAMDAVLAIAPASVLDNDLDPEGDPLTVVLVSGPSHGTLVLNADGTFVYTPDPGFVGTDSFLYYVTDGWQQSNVARVTITVTQTVHYYFLPVVMREVVNPPGQ